MGHIPEDTEWYIAVVLMEITVHGARSNVLHRNLILVRATSPEEAYAKAIRNGKNGETAYTNSKNQPVEIRFRGVSQLDAVYEPIEDGAELGFEEQIDIPESEIQAMIPPKEELRVFIAPNPGQDKDPDYRSKAVVENALKMLKR